MRYTSQYFDTATCRFFIDHHNGKAKRAKVRIRTYVDSEVSFLEIKLKNAKGVTSKYRVPFEPTERAWSSEARDFLARTIPGVGDLHPTIGNHFRRMTLVDTRRSERVTIDWDMSSRLEDVVLRHPNLVVIEVKQEGLDRHAPIMTVLKTIGARPYRVSKYCLGMTCLYPDLKSNRFKPRILHIEKVTAESFN